MQENLIVLPVILPLFFAIIMIFFSKSRQIQRGLNLVSTGLGMILAVFILLEVNRFGITAVTLGGWPAPFGITFVADLLSAIMLVMSGLIGFATAVYSYGTIDTKSENFYFYPLFQILLMGVNGAFLTGDIFNLYVWYEVMLISSFVLLALGGKPEQLEGALKYVTLNLISSAIFLAAVGILYGMAGTLNMADLARKLPLIDDNGLNIVVSMMFLISFGIKSAIFPLFFWLPAAYHTPNVAVSAFFAGLLTKVGVYSMFRVFTLIFTENIGYTHTIIVWLAVFTMLTGVLGPVILKDFRRILSMHIISQVGYMVLALGFFTQAAITAGIFYIVYHILTKTSLFYISGIVNYAKGGYHLEKLGGVFKSYPFTSILFLVAALTLAGIPPMAGFWAKYMVAKAGFETGQYTAVAVSLFVGLLTLFSMTKIWNQVFWKDDPLEGENPDEGLYKKMPRGKKLAMFAPVVFLTTIALGMAAGIDTVYMIAEQAAYQLMNPELYIQAVFGGT